MKYNYLEYWTKAFDFTGRTRRLDFWVSFLIHHAFVLILCTYILSMHLEVIYQAIAILLSFIVLFPSLALSVRRLHDSGKTGFLILIAYAPFGVLLLIVFFAQDSQPGSNKWGENPKTLSDGNKSSSCIEDDTQFNSDNLTDFNSYY